MLKPLQRGIYKMKNTQGGEGWVNWKKIETDCNCGF